MVFTGSHQGLRLLLALMSLTSVIGCAALGRRRPADDSVIEARHLCQQGLNAVHSSRWDQAESAFAQATRVCPADQRARQHYADALWRRGAMDQAIDQMKTAIKLSGGDPNLIIQLGKMDLERDQLGVALQQADLALQTNPQLTEGWALRGDVLQRQGKSQAALDSYHRALSLSPEHAEVRLRVAEIYGQMRQPRRALAVLQELADQFEPGQEPARVLFLQGIAMKEIGRYDDALEQLLLARQRTSPTPELLVHLAELQFMTGNLMAARRDLNEAQRLGANPQATRALMARIEERQGDAEVRR